MPTQVTYRFAFQPLALSPECRWQDAPALTQDVMARAQSRIGGQMNDILERNTLTPDPAFVKTVLGVKDAALDSMPEEDAKPIVFAVNKIANQMADGEGGLTGKQYLNWRQRGGLLSNLTDNPNPTVAHYGKQIKAALDDAFQSQAQGDDGQLLAQARAQYRNLKTVEPLAAKAPTGRINPTLLLGAVRSEFPDMAIKGAGDLGDLARIGQQFLKEPANSNTAERSLLLSILRTPFKAAGQAAALPLSASLGRGIGSAINSKTYLGRLTGDSNSPVPMVAMPLNLKSLLASGSPQLSALVLQRLLAPPSNEPR